MNLRYKIAQKWTNLKLRLRYLAYWIEYLSWLLLSPAKFRKYPDNTRDILIANYGAIGDLFCSLRVISSLIKNKDLKIYFLPPENSYQDMKKFEGIAGCKTIKIDDLRDNRFDLTLIFGCHPEIMKYKKNLGHIVGNEYHSIQGSFYSINNLFFVNRKISPFFRHKMDQEIGICKLAGLEINLPLKETGKIENKKVDNLLKKENIDKFLIIHPSGRNFSRIMQAGKIPALAWSLERFAAIADFLIENYGLKVILTGSEDEGFIGDKIIKLAKNKNKISNLSGLLTIPELAYLTSIAKAAISIDTSMVHIAEFTGTPIIALFGPTFYEEVGAYGNKEKQVNLAHPERCIRDRRKGESYDKENSCMSSISIEEVKRAIDGLLK